MIEGLIEREQCVIDKVIIVELKHSELGEELIKSANRRSNAGDSRVLVIGGVVGMTAAAIGSLAQSYCQDTRDGHLDTSLCPSRTGAFQARISEAVSKTWDLAAREDITSIVGKAIP